MSKIFYSIGEVAEILDIPVTTVRFWEKNFDILRPQKTSAGHRKFTPSDLENLKVIYHLVKEQGMTLEGARQRLRENPTGTSHDQEIVDRLLGIRALLVEIRQELNDEGNEVYRESGTNLKGAPPAENQTSNAKCGFFAGDGGAPLEPTHEPAPQILEQTLF
jgi:DNA-binding transcriptional MerR regulator